MSNQPAEPTKPLNAYQKCGFWILWVGVAMAGISRLADLGWLPAELGFLVLGVGGLIAFLGHRKHDEDWDVYSKYGNLMLFAGLAMSAFGEISGRIAHSWSGSPGDFFDTGFSWLHIPGILVAALGIPIGLFGWFRVRWMTPHKKN